MNTRLHSCSGGVGLSITAGGSTVEFFKVSYRYQGSTLAIVILTRPQIIMPFSLYYIPDFRTEIDEMLASSQYRTKRNDQGKLMSIVKLTAPGLLVSALCRQSPCLIEPA